MRRLNKQQVRIAIHYYGSIFVLTIRVGMLLQYRINIIRQTECLRLEILST